MHFESLDDYDNQILKLLQEDARLGYSEIGERIGLSRTAIRNRMHSLEEKGYITGYRAVINVDQAAESVMFFLDIETEPKKFEEVAAHLAGEKALRKIYAVSGECRIHAIGRVANQPTLRAYFKGLYKDLDGVNRMVCHTVLDVIKDEDAGIVHGNHEEKDNDMH